MKSRIFGLLAITAFALLATESVQSQASARWWCPAAHAYYPQVTFCQIGTWEAVYPPPTSPPQVSQSPLPQAADQPVTGNAPTLNTPAQTTTDQVCELGDKVCGDQKFLALGGDPREIVEGDMAAHRFYQAIHCPPLDAMHPGRCDGVQDGPDVWQAVLQARQRLTDDVRAAHLRACRLGYALWFSCH
jgi:hypothetical protein